MAAPSSSRAAAGVLHQLWSDVENRKDRSVLDPILFLLCTANLLRLIRDHSLNPHLCLHADDAQIYGSCAPGSTAQLLSRVSACISDVAVWMLSICLLLNADNTRRR